MGKWEAQLAFHLSMPGFIGQPRGWCCWSITRRRIWNDDVVVDAPAFGQYLRDVETILILNASDFGRATEVNGLRVVFGDGIYSHWGERNNAPPSELL
jgi:hypothetical protein